MKFVCTQENFNKGLSIVSNIASKNTNLPILNNLLIEASEGIIKLSGTNLEIGINCSIRGKIEEKGSFTVPAKIISEYVSLLPKDNIEVLLNETRLSINSSTSKTKINGQDSSEFPVIPKIDSLVNYNFSADEFILGLHQVIFAVSPNESRPEISGVYFKIDPQNKKAYLVATDSYRLAEKSLTLLNSTDESILAEKEVIVPAKTFGELLRVISGMKKGVLLEEDHSGEVGDIIKIYLSDNQILFVYNGVELISRLIEGQYPDYRQLIPENSKTTIISPKNEFIQSVKSSSLFAKSGIYDVSLKSNPGEELVISALNSQLGENTSSISANISGEENSIVLNYRYLLDGLNNINTSEVIISVTDPNIPCVLKPVLSENQVKGDYLYLIMPIRQ